MSIGRVSIGSPNREAIEARIELDWKPVWDARDGESSAYHVRRIAEDLHAMSQAIPGGLPKVTLSSHRDGWVGDYVLECLEVLSNPGRLSHWRERWKAREQGPMAELHADVDACSRRELTPSKGEGLR